MRRLGLALVVAAMAVTAMAETATFDEYAEDWPRWYVGGAGALTLPQGGSELRRLGGAAARCGYYFSDTFAVEGEAAWLENDCGLAVRGLWHWRGWATYDQLFGFSTFDPFFTLGVQGYLGGAGGQVGPAAGVGALYYLSDNWALRGDATVTLGLDTRVETVWSLTLGVQYSF